MSPVRVLGKSLLLPVWVSQSGVVSFRSEIEGFGAPYDSLNGNGEIELDIKELVYYAIHAGFLWLSKKASKGALHSRRSIPHHKNNQLIQFMQWRAISALGFLEASKSSVSNGPSCLEVNSSHDELESSEKGQISYAVGAMVGCAFVSSCDPLNFEYVVHASWAEAYLNINFPSKGRRRPDYLAFNSSGEYALLETKGRSSKSGLSELKKSLRGKSQTGIRMSSAPSMRIGCATYVAANGELEFYAVDPPALIDFEVDAEKWIEKYYESLAILQSFLGTNPAGLVAGLRRANGSGDGETVVFPRLYLPGDPAFTKGGDKDRLSRELLVKRLVAGERDRLKGEIEEAVRKELGDGNFAIMPDLSILVLEERSLR